MSESEKNSKEYEMSYFLIADITEGAISDAVNELKSLIAENGGENVTPETPKKRWLAYKINKQNESYFGVVYFNINVDGLEKLRKSLMLNRKILRYMILNKISAAKQPETSAKLNDEQTSAPVQSFDQKLENILNS